MSWIKDHTLSWFQLFCVRVVKTGGVPQHVAFIMDGNRRFAKKKHVSRGEGHAKGFEKLSETLKWCIDLGIPEVTVYAFSIENFKRSKEEVDTLMELAKEKFQRLLNEVDQMREWGVRVVIAGRTSLLPPDIRSLAARAALATRRNNTLRLNIAYAYTGRDEIARAIGDVVLASEEGVVNSEDVDEHMLSSAMQLSKPQLLVRTSGEVRLSDFLLWQISDTVLYFTDVLWPEFSIWNMIAAILHYQRHAPSHIINPPVEHTSDSCSRFVKDLEEKQLKKMEESAAFEVSKTVSVN